MTIVDGCNPVAQINTTMNGDKAKKFKLLVEEFRVHKLTYFVERDEEHN